MFQAQMSNSGGRWRLYVVLMGVSKWPEHRWPGAASVPTLAERVHALAALGYEIVPEGRWEWLEDCTDPLDARSPVLLIASVPVRRPCVGAGILTGVGGGS
ncbi:DUF6303 family protein [Streptomyces sp. NPDC058290]|uniref:DUF6303 family protein n=1 Tax=Streptomyces sp. NPDC058290 TaxID=3346426 RepID=UPI0036E455CF